MRVRALLLTLAVVAATWLTAAAHTTIASRPTLDAVFASMPTAAEVPAEFIASPDGRVTVRTAPDVAADPIAAVHRQVIVTGESETRSGVEWREVITEAGLGWVPAHQLDTRPPGGEDR